MKCLKLLLILFITVNYGIFTVNAQTNFYKSVVTGRVVDELGNPVPYALVNIEPLEEDEIDYKNNIKRADENGWFSVVNTSPQSTRIRSIYISSGRERKGVNFIYLPSMNLKKISSSYCGKELKLTGNEMINLGDIQVQVWFNNIEVFVIDVDGSPYFTNDADWKENFYFVLRDKKKRFVAGQGISTDNTKNFVNLKKGSVKLEIPVGTWVIELVKDLSDLKSIIATKEITVKKGDEIMKAKLLVK